MFPQRASSNRIWGPATAVGLLACAMGTPALATSTTFDATANIHIGLTIISNANLNFASIVPSASQAGAITITPAGGRTCDPVLQCSGSTSAAGFDVAGAEDASYAITLPSSATLNSGANTMVIDSFVSSIGTTGVLTGGGESFTLGATLQVDAAQPVGAYTGSFSVTVEYN